MAQPAGYIKIVQYIALYPPENSEESWVLPLMIIHHASAKESLSETLETQLATKSDMSSIRTELAVLKWMMGAMLGIGFTILFKLFS